MSKKNAPKRARGRAAGLRPSASVMVLKDSLGWWSVQYVQWIRERNYSERTASGRAGHLAHFVAWCEARSVYYPQEVTKPVLDRYQRSLFHHRKDDGRPLSFAAQAGRLVSVRTYFKWLTRQNVLPYNPASEMELPKVTHHLPRFVLTVSEAEAVLALPDVNEVLGLRDRAMLEVLYSTGIRRAELVALRVFDVDAHRGTVMVREGKGRKDRVVPIGERALGWVEKYVSDSRSELVLGTDEGALFLTSHGEGMTLVRASQIAQGYVRSAQLGKTGACHLFRHTAATLMLENGADIRYIQALLGHARLDTTQLYTQVSIHKLKQVHALTHPGAALVPPRQGGREDAASESVATSEELFSLLAAEGEDERVELGEGDS